MFNSPAAARQPIKNKFDLSSIAQAFLEEPGKNSTLVQEVTDQVLLQARSLDSQFKFVLLFLKDKDQPNLLKQAALAKNQNLQAGEKNYQVKNLAIPLTATDNYCVQAVLEKDYGVTSDLTQLLCPPLSKDKAQRLQEISGVKTFLMMPVLLKDQVVGVIIYGTKKKVKDFPAEELNFINSMNTLISVAAENSRLFAQIETDREELKKKNARLKRNDKMKDEFVAVASHELRTPMTAIKNYVWLALNKEEKGMTPRAKECLEIAYNATRRTIDLINEMLVMSRIENDRYDINPQVMDVEDMVNEVCIELKPLADEKNIEFDWKSRYKNLMVNGDKTKLAEAFRNVIENAIKFTHQGKVKVRMDKKEYMIVVKITDDGPGIADSDLPRLFVKFSRLENSYAKMPESGTGLGLYISQQIVKKHEGKIEIESEFGVGSTFTISIPEKTISQATPADEK